MRIVHFEISQAMNCVRVLPPFFRAWLIPFTWALAVSLAYGQCKPAMDEVDAFDSTRTVAAKPVNIGYLIPSNFETANGPKMIEEAKLLFSFSENDSIRSFFLTVAVQEREFLRIDNDFNVLLLLDDEQVIATMNVSDQGVFDPATNMRLYQHTCVVPLDLFFALTHLKVAKIRINYRTYKHTIDLSERQRTELREAVRCVGEAVQLIPLRP